MDRKLISPRAGRRAGVLLVTLLLVAGLTTATGWGSSSSSAKTVLRFPQVADVGTLDPAQISATADIKLATNLFGGLYRFDRNLTEVPDIATALPQVSKDGRTYVFRLRKNVTFSNGDRVTARDVVYSWNRTAAAQGAYAGTFEPVAGYGAVVKAVSNGKKPPPLTGLSTRGKYEVVAHLSYPASYWLTELATWPAYVVNRRVIEARGENSWWTTPSGLVGTGPFKMVARTPKASLTFAPVSRWWGGSTGSLTRVEIDMVPDAHSWNTTFQQGGYNVVGLNDQFLAPEDVLSYEKGPNATRLHLAPGARTTFLGFNFKRGPFAGIEAGKAGRRAFSLAIDRRQVAEIACAGGAICEPAQTGFIPPGLAGHLGRVDPNSRFDPALAKRLYQQWDPDGTKVRGLTFYYPITGPKSQLVSENLQAQWQEVLGVRVRLEPVPPSMFFSNRGKQLYPFFYFSWGADYNNPQNWYGLMYTCSGLSNGTGYCNRRVDRLADQAERVPLRQSLPLYAHVERVMQSDVALGTITYDRHAYLIQPGVSGAGGNGLYDYPWTGIKIK